MTAFRCVYQSPAGRHRFYARHCPHRPGHETVGFHAGQESFHGLYFDSAACYYERGAFHAEFDVLDRRLHGLPPATAYPGVAQLTLLNLDPKTLQPLPHRRPDWMTPDHHAELDALAALVADTADDLSAAG